MAQIDDKTYSLSTELGVGYSRYFTTMDYDKLNKNGFSGTVRVMWNPEHLLSTGLETGYQYLYSFNYDGYETEFGTTDISASMYTIPVFIMEDLGKCDFIIEAAVENIPLKWEIFTKLDEVTPPETILASNTFYLYHTYRLGHPETRSGWWDALFQSSACDEID